MKRLASVFFTLLVLLSLLGCNHNSENIEAPANFYYRNGAVAFFESDSVITSEVRETATQSNLLDLLNIYLQGPITEKLISPFPEDTHVVEVERGTDTIRITFNEAFSSLSGFERSVACSCICATVTELTGCSTVELIIVQSQTEESQSIAVARDDLYFIDSFASN